MRRTFRYGSMAVAAAALISAGIAFVAPATAQDKMAVVTERQDLMKSNGRDAGKIAAFLQKGQGTADDVAKAAADIAAHAKKLPTLFVAGTTSAELPGKTRAKPELITNKAKAEQYAATLGEKAMAVEAAAKGGDKQAIQAAFGAMSREACGACHNDFRGPPLK
jgi:cytochrome c556